MKVNKLNILPLIPITLFLLNTLYSPEIQSTRALYESKERDDRTEIPIMTFNVRWADLNNKEDNGPYSWPARRQKVFDIINHYKPLIVGTQEALILQHNDMMNSLKDYSSIGFCKVTILYRKSEVEVVSQGEFWLEEGVTQYSENIRRASWGIFKFKKDSIFSFTDMQFLVINTHNSPRSESKRRISVKILLNKALELSNNGTIPIFLTGDFNANPKQFSHQFLVESEDGIFSDSWNVCKDLGPAKCLQNNVPCSYHHFLGGQVNSWLARFVIQYPLFIYLFIILHFV
eukprot:TRINITY_DN2439_c0_g1_i6.p1 TRINITY_DN2439_c0_g1~~TRINITY_DN2439_c0_g1_i6.p1  ORF type:complete len:309 (-),score=60.34 TRINITY_DN2439_c0_g1_i6:119-982(-)